MYKKIRSIFAFVTALLLIFLVSIPSEAQRNVSYQELAERNVQQQMFFDFFSLPGDTDKAITFVSAFSISYNFLPFRKENRSNSGREGGEFLSAATLNMEVFKSDPSNIGKENVSVEGLESVNRSSWSDTAYAQNYEQTQSFTKFLPGNLSVKLSPGVYSYMLQMNRGEARDASMSQTRTVGLNPYERKKYGDILIAESVMENSPQKQLRLLNLGNRIIYGEDYYAFAHIPRYKDSQKYSLVVERMNINQKDTTAVEEIFSQDLDKNHILTDIKPVLVNNSRGKTEISLNSHDQGSAYALVQIPNKRFPNAAYRIKIMQEGSSTPSARDFVRSIWFDMPTSLLNLNVAIDMLQFIADRSTIREIKSGSGSEREKKFREFWKEKDPTPKTEFNELMAEYYRRIDYAYENFTTMNKVGYESDQGEVYIKFGPPKDIQRRFPTSGTTTEIWSYDSREFVFRATSGFGDFQLVSD